ncbi:MAG: GAF domain-containing protein [Eubacterium sp.]|nr:GAF domain-containing protein [Eubacterium sp.]
MDYKTMNAQLVSLCDGVENNVTLLANASALLWYSLEDINWAGFYIYEGGELILGPFQGKPACVKIPLGRGVCGTAAKEGKTLRVDNVHLFKGHIACDSASNSEIVVPIIKNGVLFGVLDIDSPSLSRFNADDEKGLGDFVKILEDVLK